MSLVMLAEVIVLVLLVLLVYAWVAYPVILALLTWGSQKRGMVLMPTCCRSRREGAGRTHPEGAEITARAPTMRTLSPADREFTAIEESCTEKKLKTNSPMGGGTDWPCASLSVSIIFSAYNEESVIRERLENLSLVSASIDAHFSSASRDRRLNILVGVDASTDKTAEIARECASRHTNIHVREFNERRGKVAVLKELVKESHQLSVSTNQSNQQPPTSILIFTDANTMFRPDVIEKLLSHFSDPAVGGVCGRLEFTEKPTRPAKLGRSRESRGQEEGRLNSEVESQGLEVNRQSTACSPQPADERSPFAIRHASMTPSPPEGFYWRWETRLKVMESRLDSCLGANGAIYAMRSELFWTDIPDNTVVDDFVIGMKIRQQGFRMVYDPAAVAEEEFPAVADEWGRRVRIGAGDYQALNLCRRCMLPQYGTFAWMFLSHKVLRWFTPHMVLAMASISVLSVVKDGRFTGYGIPLAVMVGIAGLCACSVIGRLLRNTKAGCFGLLRACDYFVTMQAAVFVGFLRFCKSDLRGSWDRTARR
jgi:glycosyltransferase involved in cell wall biosynthesis